MTTFLIYLKSLELMKLASITEKNQKLEEAAKYREEVNQNFSKQTEQRINIKMETNKENKEALYNNLMERLKKTVSLLISFVYYLKIKIKIRTQGLCKSKK
jgi:uncharacterized protein YdiU (UPF0061 family)